MPLSHDISHILGAFLAAFIAGGINSVAGGGTLISFPILVMLGLPPIIANATNTVGIWPGSIGSIWGFRRQLLQIKKRLYWLVVPALVGAAIGAELLKNTPSHIFEHVIPALILAATILLILQKPLQERLKKLQAVIPGQKKRRWVWLWSGALVLQLLAAIYGGYFGAGMSIIMLSVLGLIGMRDMLQMSGFTSVLGFCVNGIAGIIFIASGMVSWPIVGAMFVGSIMGGYLAAKWALHHGGSVVRKFVIAMGFILTIVALWRVFGK